jgi:hypothetical protein
MKKLILAFPLVAASAAPAMAQLPDLSVADVSNHLANYVIE